MGLRDRLQHLAEAVRPGGPSQPLVEAASATYDPDLAHNQANGFRSLGVSNPHLSLQPLQHDRALIVAYTLSRQHPIGKRVPEIMRDFTVGDELRPDLGPDATETVKAYIDEFWALNRLEIEAPRMAHALSVSGEQIIPVQQRKVDGMPRLGFIDPYIIQGVRYLPQTDQASDVVLRGSQPEQERSYSVIRPLEGEDLKRANAAIPQGKGQYRAGDYGGEVFYWSINRARGGERGLSDLLAVADWIDAHEEFLFASLDRAKLGNMTYLKVTVTGADDAKLKQMALRYAHAPKMGTVDVTNEKVEQEWVAPNLGAQETHREQKTVRDHIGGGAGMPGWFFGSGEEVNKASAGEMALPTLKMMKQRRTALKAFYCELIYFALSEGRRHGRLGDRDLASVDLTLNMAELDDNKLGALGAAVSSMISSILLARDAGLMSDHAAQRAIAMYLSETGFDYDPEKDQDELEKDRAAREERDAQAVADALERLNRQREGDPAAGGEREDEGAPAA